MRVEFAKAFHREVKELPAEARAQVAKAVQQVVDAPSLHSIPHIKKLKGASNAFRIRAGDIGLAFSSTGRK